MAAFHFVALYIFSCLHESNAYYPVPEVEINLDLPAAERWRPAIDAILAIHSFKDTFGATFAAANQSTFNTVPPADYAIYTNAIRTNWPQNYAELEGISSYFSAKYNEIVTVEYLSLWVYFHELLHAAGLKSQKQRNRACTGILVRDTNDNIFHGRNFDQTFAEARNLTLSLSFTRNGQEIFKGLDWYWFTTGVVTAYKSNVLSIQENYRFQEQTYADILSLVKENRIPQVLLFREILSQPDVTFTQCSNQVAQTPLISPMYAVLGGTQGIRQGHIITRYVNESVVLDFANITAHSTGNYRGYNPAYYMVQTNYDLWEVDPADDDRRTVAETLLSTWNRSKDTQIVAIGANLQAVMSSDPVYNQDTFYTGIFAVSYDLFLAYIRQSKESIA